MTRTQELFKGLEEKGTLLFDEPLWVHTTFKIGGNAEVFFTPRSEDALIGAVKTAKRAGVPYYIFGNGSNLLVDDAGLTGIVIRIGEGLDEIRNLGNGRIFCGAGCRLVQLCNYALNNSMAGLEFAYGIPGSVGGAIFMNAGAYGGEIGDVIGKVRCYDPEKDAVEEIDVSDLVFKYRDTDFMKSGKIILAGYFKLDSGDEKDISARMTELIEKRRSRQPLDKASAGSTFKRPEGYYAGVLIENAGLKGFTVGGAQVSPKHAGFVVNNGDASCKDVLAVIDHVREKVFEENKVHLETEVIYLKNE